jgi:hypothetical protein
MVGRPVSLGSAHGLGAFGVYQARVVHLGVAEASVRRSARGSTRGGAKGSEHVTLEREHRHSAQFLFRLADFKNTKLQFLTTKLKFSKHNSCKGAVTLQLSQRVTYVLVKGLVGIS